MAMQVLIAAMAAHALTFAPPPPFPPAHALPQQDASVSAVAVLNGSSSVKGIVNLSQQAPGGPTNVELKITGLKPGKHGFHLHQFGDLSNSCLSAGPHYNPKKMSHGAPGDRMRHAGDLGNVVAGLDGIAETTIVDLQIPLGGPNSVIGRAFVVHELEDDLGKGGQELSLTTGNAGGRLACGVVGLSSK
ncbi:hypothetical protein GOP47_0000125 [Adiantum capillus-veneris]|uniref:Superoxide dismutase [Cu-Zn] n=1 Tax=Adiantum capillus-veneris TaxID=13818 RepID=A0A9D4VCG5_ADICA|nr:hypothetical protein GOP47_0000125 [Adiantum capillus-veneris]